MKDYYYILGVKSSATNQQIKSAFRKLSLKLHPDQNSNDKFFEERFKEIQEAYEILNDVTKRTDYDKKSKVYQFDTEYSENQARKFEEEIRKKYEDELRRKEEEIKRKYQTPEQRFAEEAEERKKQEEKRRKEEEEKKKRIISQLINDKGELENTLQQKKRILKDLKEKVNSINTEIEHLNKAIAKISKEIVEKNGRQWESLNFGYQVIRQKEDYDLAWGRFIDYEIEFMTGTIGHVYKSKPSGMYFYIEEVIGQRFAQTLDEVAHNSFLYRNTPSK